MLSQKSGGIPPLAATSALISNALGVIVTPSYLSIVTSISNEFNWLDLVIGVTFKMLVPLIAGQCIRQYATASFVTTKMDVIVLANQVCVVLLLLQIISDVVLQSSYITSKLFIKVIISIIILHTLICITSWLLSNKLYISKPAKRITYLYTSTTKTIVLGLPMIHVIYKNNDNLIYFIIPLVIYHFLELVQGIILAPWFKVWCEKTSESIIDNNAVSGVLSEREEGQDEEDGERRRLLTSQVTFKHSNKVTDHVSHNGADINA
jgi:sodium/bile acid cotransporter 7